MSRLAKRPIAIPPGVEITAGDSVVSVKGPLGTLSRAAGRGIQITVTPEGVQLTQKSSALAAFALLGTYASHIRNMIEGVTKGFTQRMLIEGVGYKWDVMGDSIKLALGFSHPVNVKIPQGVKASVEKGVLTLSGNDKEVIGQFAANIRALKVPEPYKGKGIRYDGEVIRRKQGKKTA
jgi:large subunit ribosomal protein L6